MHSLWFNIGVADLQRAAQFYSAIGFEQDSAMTDAMLKVTLPDGSYIMLFPHETLEQFLPAPYLNTRTEVLISIGVKSRNDVQEIVDRVRAAGGEITAKPMEFKGMYGAGFTDLDGHHFNLLVI